MLFCETDFWKRFLITTFIQFQTLATIEAHLEGDAPVVRIVIYMYTQSIILPFDIEGRIYVLEDENGRIVGTGRREVCVALFQIIDRAKSAGNREPPPQRTPLNVRSAIVIFDDGNT